MGARSEKSPGRRRTSQHDIEAWNLPFSPINLCKQTPWGRGAPAGQVPHRREIARPGKSTRFSGRSLSPCPFEIAAAKTANPDLQGRAPRSFNVRGVRDGDSGGFRIFGRYPNWAFRDSGHFCPRKIPLRPLLLFETGRIQTATVAQLGQE